MLENRRDRMIAGINTVSGRSDCSEAVILQQRSSAAVVVLIVLFGIVMTLIRLIADVGSLVVGGMAGLIIGVGTALVTTTYWLGHCNGDIVLVKTNRWQNKAVEVAATYRYPIAATVGSGLLIKRVQVADISYLMARQLEDRLRTITGR